ncbi:MAPEG family protein [Massilia sp. H27-R4]|nr:MAPEG family protein [Massilia sp. H27-R4]
MFETLPLFAAAVLIAHVGGREGALTLWGAWAYLIARVVYVPLYAAGIPVVRSIVWTASMVGLGMVLVAILMP